MKKYYYLWLWIIILIALFLRLYHLTYHSLWFDEAISVYWAKQSTARILEVGFTLEEDRLPPLYYLTLKGWGQLFGFTEITVRLLTVFFGTLLVPVTANVTYRIFRRRRLACFTALLIALNPFLIWYSQEARMYAPAVFYSTLMVWAALKMIETVHLSRQHRSYLYLILFILTATTALYSHLYTGFLLPALGIWLMISYPKKWRSWFLFSVGGIVITLMYVPILLAIWRFSGEASPGDPFTGFGQRAWSLLQAMTIWQAPLSSSLPIIIPAMMTLFILFAYLKTPAPTHLKNPRLLVSLLLVSPFLIATLLLTRNYLAFFGERYFIEMVPWLLLLAALGADNLGQWLIKFSHNSNWLRYIPFLILLPFVSWPIPGQWNPATTKEAWRQTVAYLAQNSAPDHGILIHPDWVRYPFQFYFTGPGQTYAAFSNVTAETDLDGPLQGVLADHPVIWLIQSHLEGPDPDHRVEQWFAARYPLITELYPPGITLKGFAIRYQLDTLPPEAHPITIPFENGMELIGYQADKTASATDNLFHPPSGWIHVTLYWKARQPITETAVPFVHLVGPQGVWGISLDRPTDALKIYPPSRWSVQSPQIIRHDLDINLNPQTPPGTYHLMIGLHGQEKTYPLSKVVIQN